LLVKLVLTLIYTDYKRAKLHDEWLHGFAGLPLTRWQIILTHFEIY